mgnify:CR=1 FL=1
MNRIKHALVPLFSTSLLFIFFGATSLFPEYSRAERNNGSIVFYTGDDNQPPGNPICTLSFTHGEYSFPDIENCQNDEARWFKLVDVPSATFVRFDDHPSCEDGHDQNFIFILKTVKNDLTMQEPVSMESLKGVTEGQIVPGAPGLRMERNYVDKDNDQVKGKLSCVEIIRSAIPD